MKKILGRSAVKVVLILLLLAMSVLILVGGVGIFLAGNSGFYSKEETSFIDFPLSTAVYRKAFSEYVDIKNVFLNGNDLDLEEKMRDLEEKYSWKSSNIAITILNADDKIFLTTVSENEAVELFVTFHIYESEFDANKAVKETKSADIAFLKEAEKEIAAEIAEDFQTSAYSHKIIFYLREDMPIEDDIFFLYEAYKLLKSNSISLIFYEVSAIGIAIMLYCLILTGAGRRANDSGAHLRIADKLPLEVNVIFTAIAVYTCVIVLHFLFYSFSNYFEVLLLAFSAIVPMGVLSIVLLSMTVAVRVKAGKWWKNTLIYKLLALIWRGIRFLLRAFSALWRNLAVAVKIVLMWVVCCFFSAAIVIKISRMFTFGLALMLFMIAIALLAVWLWLALQNERLHKGIDKISAGDTSYKIKTDLMLPPIRLRAERLNGINDAISAAVEEKMKGERLKTELITNVSHDIKTPITAIVSYVELLKQEKLENEKAMEYIEVIDRQSQRLKKLAFDVVEASKLSSGIIAAELAPVNFCELIEQSVGEYSDRFEESKLEVVFTPPKEDILINADSRLCWRIMDNLLSNIKKYALAGTRIYIDIVFDDFNVMAVLKNTSAAKLNISSEELMERFVRGDRSRNTEGSGLGLSIAKSLANLQKGNVITEIDGDLFKVKLIMPRYRGKTQNLTDKNE